MSIKVVDLLGDVQKILNDDGTRWPLTELQSWINAGYRAIVDIRPDAGTLVDTFNCVAGVRQNLTTIFPGAIELIDVVRNVAAGSNKQTVEPIDLKALNQLRRNWPSDTASIDIEYFVPDTRVQNQFMVYPPATSSAQIEVIYSQIPTPHTLTLLQLQNTATTETIRLLDCYANPLLDYVLYRAFMKDQDIPASAARSAAHFQAFMQSLGAKTEGDGATKPRV